MLGMAWNHQADASEWHNIQPFQCAKMTKKRSAGRHGFLSREKLTYQQPPPRPGFSWISSSTIGMSMHVLWNSERFGEFPQIFPTCFPHFPRFVHHFTDISYIFLSFSHIFHFIHPPSQRAVAHKILRLPTVGQDVRLDNRIIDLRTARCCSGPVGLWDLDR